MKKRKFPLLIVMGVILIVISFCLLFFLQLHTHTGAEKCKKIVAKIQELLPDKTSGIPEAYPELSMPILEINGKDYIALLDVPSLGITLPVADKWDSKKLFISPARFNGSAYDNSLVIGGTDNSHQFGFCNKIEDGAYITVTDVLGTCFTYTVANVERSKSAENQWLTDEAYDLTLFYRDTYSTDYIAVRCSFVYSTK